MPHLACPICHKQIYRRPSRVFKHYTTCSRTCQKEYEAKFHPKRIWLKRKTTFIVKSCLNCSAVIRFPTQGAKHNERKKFCSKSCLYKYNSMAYRGAYSFGWKGGTSEKYLRYGSGFDLARKEVEKRDGGICQECGIDKEGAGWKKMHTHHINGDSKNHSLDNLITLCDPCHKKAHRSR